MKKQYHWFNHVFNFLAVILGVYLAFYMNERAKVNQEKSEKKVFLESLVQDLTKDVEVYETFQVQENERIIQNVEQLLASLTAEDEEAIQVQLPNILQVENFAPTSSTYTSLKSSGKLSLFNDLELQKHLADFYEDLVGECERKGEFQVEYFTDDILKWFSENVDIINMHLLPKNDLMLFRNKIIIYQSLLQQKTDTYKMVVEESKSLISEIQALLDDK